jgi:hypothetical protein
MIKTQNHEMSLAWEQSGHDRGVSRAARSNTLSYDEPYVRTYTFVNCRVTVRLDLFLSIFLKSKMDGRLYGKTG